MEPEVFFYDKSGESHLLYVGGISTAEGLSLFSPQEPVSIARFGATNYKSYGWATEQDLPPFANVQELRSFLTSGELGLIDFEAEVGSDASVSSHDDSECTITFGSRTAFVSAVQSLAPQSCSGALLHALLSNPTTYIRCAEDGQAQCFKTFDEYLAKCT